MILLYKDIIYVQCLTLYHTNNNMVWKIVSKMTKYYHNPSVLEVVHELKEANLDQFSKTKILI